MAAHETPEERIARWTATDAAIGNAAEVEQLRRRVAERDAEIADLNARVAQLSSRVAQLDSENAVLRRRAGRMSLGTFARKVVRRLRA